MQTSFLKLSLAMLCCCVQPGFGQSLAPAPVPQVPSLLDTIINVIPPVAPPVPVPPPQPPTINPANLPPEVIAWDAGDKAVSVTFGEPNARFQFFFTNISSAPVTVFAVTSSCGCTAAQVPPMPWVLPAGTNASFVANMNLAGKNGTVIKNISFATDKGTKHLLVRTTINPMTNNTGAMAPGSREQNQLLALADRQSVFKGDCASCHVEKAKGKQDRELYVAACGICHDAEHRGSMVPDLRIAKPGRDVNYWHNWIAVGRQGSIMPAFAQTNGGPFTDEQIKLLSMFLVNNPPQTNAPAAH